MVQFVPFNEYKNNPELLAKNVLQELPDQVVDYMTLINKKPGERKCTFYYLNRINRGAT